MLPASTRGSGQNIGFPDVCNTPSGPATVPVPYTNLADHTQASGFSTVVSICGSNALHLSTTIPMTSGDEAGTAHSTTKGQATFTSGNSVVFIENKPAITLTSSTTGNSNNCSSASVLVPGAATVLFTRRGDDVVEAAEAMFRSDVTATPFDGALCLRLHAIAPATPSRVHHALRGHRGALVLDLRGNPGGDLRAMVRLAEMFLPRGAPIVRYAETSERVLASRHAGDVERKLALLVDGGTASAAELLAAALRDRARIFGERTHGKAHAQRVIAGDYVTVGSCRGPHGEDLARGVSPDVVTSDPLAAAEQWLRMP